MQKVPEHYNCPRCLREGEVRVVEDLRPGESIVVFVVDCVNCGDQGFDPDRIEYSVQQDGEWQ
jgi:transcription elongation factor Elf1